MNTLTKLSLLTLALFHLPATGLAQSYSVSGAKIATGGGVSAGGSYSLLGTIGQPDAGATMTGGTYAVTGGFQSLNGVVPPSEAPTLLIVPSGAGTATVSWSPATPGFVLQTTATLSPPVWLNATTGTTNPVVVPSISGVTFYRLKHL